LPQSQLGGNSIPGWLAARFKLSCYAKLSPYNRDRQAALLGDDSLQKALPPSDVGPNAIADSDKTLLG